MSNKDLKKNTSKITDVDLSGISNEITQNTDVTCDPFPFTEENNKSYEHAEYGTLP